MDKIGGAIEVAIVALCGAAWAMAGFPRFVEIAASFGSIALLCFGAFCAWMIWDAKE
jgi:hypothetical protein